MIILLIALLIFLVLIFCAVKTEGKIKKSIIITLFVMCSSIIAFFVFMIVTFMLHLGVGSRWGEKFELNESNFDSEVMQYIESTTGIDLPEDSKGLNFYYKPPVDPCFIAKIAIPLEYKNKIEQQIVTFEAIEDYGLYLKDWWPKEFNGLISSKVYYRTGGASIFAYLVIENEKLILYLQYLTR